MTKVVVRVVIRRRRRDANRLGFAVHLAYLRFPGRVIGVDENPSLDMLCFIEEQIGVSDRDFEEYATRSQTRRAHLSELQAYLGVGPFDGRIIEPSPKRRLGNRQALTAAMLLSP